MVDKTEAEADAPCRLLKLPGELRNRVNLQKHMFTTCSELTNLCSQIYRYVLVLPEHAPGAGSISINANGYDRPKLLSTCKVIRKEALKIFYQENTFKIHVNNYDSLLLVRWDSHLRSMRVRQRGEVVVAIIEVLNEPRWANLLLWLERRHGRKVRYRVQTPRELLGLQHADGAADYLMGAMFMTVDEFRDQPWSRVEKHIQNFRPALIAFDNGWAKD